ncbi:hypothetical protein [Amycolatopsis lexingtonensis]
MRDVEVGGQVRAEEAEGGGEDQVGSGGARVGVGEELREDGAEDFA